MAELIAGPSLPMCTPILSVLCMLSQSLFGPQMMITQALLGVCCLMPHAVFNWGQAFSALKVSRALHQSRRTRRCICVAQARPQTLHPRILDWKESGAWRRNMFCEPSHANTVAAKSITTKKSGKSIVLVFFRVWSFNLHAPYILSADDLGDFAGICRKPSILEADNC